MTAERPMPTQDEVLEYFRTLSNWGRWGDDDELGTLNHITDDARLAAARAVRHGRSVSCAWEIAAPQEMERSTTTCPCAADMPGGEDMPGPFHADRRWGFSSEQLGLAFHGDTVTHLDAPCHLFWDGTMYNGRPHTLVDAATGSAWAAVTAAANGIITRGVLLDVAAARDVPWLEPGQGVFPADLEEAERRQMPVHAVSLVAMGLWLLDNCDLEACATTAAELGRWDFHLTVAPVRFAGTSGSPVNPIATF